ncbi:efflux RND transporter periplasmic adaptor subunit [Zobellella maritima]|uniref:efflux RND transporter periplasmic adaptor subunit n=1 Tax=Zobellella maritima TaxID=2059725 RepID=UPI000E306FE5|nr:HlyD family efflux transporter periplasmic adaptor subunit [Zobellella maritima]
MKILIPMFSLALLLSPLLVQAHGDEDHGDVSHAEPAGSNSTLLTSDKPRRLPDGRVFLPKETQRRLALRTLVPEEQQVARTVMLNGHVVMDPNASGRVQPLQAGRLMAGPSGLPLLGQKVAKGEILAQVMPAVSTFDLATQAAQIADWEVRRQLAEKELGRLRNLSTVVPRKEIDAAEAELAGLTAQIKALKQGVIKPELLLSPIDGVIASSSVVNGQVVESKEIVFEVVDPARLLIEAQVYDPKVANRIVSASIPNDTTPLTYIGSGKALREGALPLLFRAQDAQDLVLGQLLTIVAQTDQTLRGMPLPASAIVKNAANESVVWLHVDPEYFVAEPVQVQPLDGEQVVVTGLREQQRVVVQGATLLNQIR